MVENAGMVDDAAAGANRKFDALGVAGVATPGIGAAGAPTAEVLKTVFLPHVT